jgi:small-conductance mechanosensitive channel
LIRNYEQEHTEAGGCVTALRAASFYVRLILFVIIILLALDNMGVKITSLVASFGIGTVAVVLAVQNILADLFASLSIALDHPL